MIDILNSSKNHLITHFDMSREENKKSQQLSILDRLANNEQLISDGATGTYLQKRGLEPGNCPEVLNATHPDLIQRMALDYFEAGSNLVLTNSFGANKFNLKKYGFEDRVEELNLLAAEHACSQAKPGNYVLGSVGPTGEFLAPLGEVSSEEMIEDFIEQISALRKGGVDGVLIETKTSLEEASLAIKAAKEYTDLVTMCTMTFDKGPRGFFTMMGVTPDKGIIGLQNAGADVVGANCGNGIDDMVLIARLMRQATNGYLILHSNAGIPSISNGEIIYPETPEYMANRFKDIADIGVNIIGGCCGTDVEHIRAFSERLKTD